MVKPYKHSIFKGFILVHGYLFWCDDKHFGAGLSLLVRFNGPE
jgi:hypothetical protein